MGCDPTSIKAKVKTINRVKIEFMEWEKIFANYVSKKGLICKIEREPNSLAASQTWWCNTNSPAREPEQSRDDVQAQPLAVRAR